MRAGDSDGSLVVLHQLTKQFCTCKHRDLVCDSLDQFCVVAAYGSGIHDTVDVVSDIRSFLPIDESKSPLGAAFSLFLKNPIAATFFPVVYDVVDSYQTLLERVMK